MSWTIDSETWSAALRALTRVGAAVALAALGGACATGNAGSAAAGEVEAVAAAPAAAADEATAEPAAAEPAAAAEAAAEEEVEWLVDENGQRYHLRQYSKKQAYMRLEDGTVRVIGGIPIQVEREDDDWFYYRLYEVKPVERVVKDPGPTPEELAAAYASDTTTADRLELRPFSTGLPTSGQWRNGFSLADMNGDGHLDIVHSIPRKSLGGPVIFLGDGAGSWRRSSSLQLPPKHYDYGDARVADLDGDGRPDLVLGMHLVGLAALRNAGDGRFEDWGRGLAYEAPGRGGQARGFSSRALAIVDWNRDGRPDIAALGEGPRMSAGGDLQASETPRPQEVQSYGLIVYLNQGDGSWEALSRGNEYGQNFGDSIVVADFDGDGWPDLATGSNAMGTRGIVHLNREEGTSWETVDVAALRPRTYARAVAAGDVDGDGRAELFAAVMSYEAAEWRTGIELFDLEGGTWTRKPLYVEESRDGIWTLAAGDLDGDGRVDVAGTTGNGRTVILLGGPDGGYTLEEPGVDPFPGGCRGYHVAIADLDGDGAGELVEAFAGEPNAMYEVLTGTATCPSSGGMRAWDPQIRATAAAAAPAR